MFFYIQSENLNELPTIKLVSLFTIISVHLYTTVGHLPLYTFKSLFQVLNLKRIADPAGVYPESLFRISTTLTGVLLPMRNWTTYYKITQMKRLSDYNYYSHSGPNPLPGRKGYTAHYLPITSPLPVLQEGDNVPRSPYTIILLLLFLGREKWYLFGNTHRHYNLSVVMEKIPKKKYINLDSKIPFKSTTTSKLYQLPQKKITKIWLTSFPCTCP